MMNKDAKIKAIVESDVFRALNMLIDQKAFELVSYMKSIKSRVARLEGGASLGVRVSHEEGGVAGVDLPFPIDELDQVEHYIARTKALKQEINDLQKFKLRLLNDYDFTHGDGAEQRRIFGDSRGTRS